MAGRWRGVVVDWIIPLGILGYGVFTLYAGWHYYGVLQ